MSTTMFKRILVLLLTTVFSLLSSNSLAHASEFTTDFRSVYELREDGSALVIHQIAIENNLAHIFTTEYAILVGSTDLTNVQGQNNGEPLPLDVKIGDSTTTLKATLPNPQVGQGKVTHLTISYETSSLVNRLGSNWEINIPAVARANEYRSYSRTLHLPSSLGEATASFPVASSHEPGIYTYLGYPQDSISLFFGESQSYSVNLSYLLTNPTLNTQTTELALPPDTAYQQVALSKLTPAPLEIRLDADGNWLASYSLKSQETLAVQAELTLTVSPLPIYSLPPLKTPLLGSTSHWQVDDSSIRDLASRLGKPQAIYDYLVENFSYDYTRAELGERLGAKQALASPELAICTEYTDAFIALARAAGYSAREINGYAYTDNPQLKPQGSSDVLHAWPEYYDESTNTWVAIDPTWGHTTGKLNYWDKLDYHHLAFVIHGAESTYPLPAGAYKTSPEDRQISVTPLDSKPTFTPTYQVEVEGSHYRIKNTGQISLRNHKITLPSGASHTIEYLPPLGSETTLLAGDSRNLFMQFWLWLKTIFTSA